MTHCIYLPCPHYSPQKNIRQSYKLSDVSARLYRLNVNFSYYKLLKQLYALTILPKISDICLRKSDYECSVQSTPLSFGHASSLSLFVYPTKCLYFLCAQRNQLIFSTLNQSKLRLQEWNWHGAARKKKPVPQVKQMGLAIIHFTDTF